MRVTLPKRRKVILVGILVLLLGTLVLCWPLIRRHLGVYLIDEDTLVPANCIYVLSGAPLDRGLTAAKLFKEGYAPQLVCTGSLVPTLMRSQRMNLPEAQLTANVIRWAGVDSAAVTVERVGTSTYEECTYLRAQAQQEGYKAVIIVSSRMHTRRIQFILHHLLPPLPGCKFVVRGAPASDFDEAAWWKKEEGLLFVNNEYVKLLYYAIHYPGAS